MNHISKINFLNLTKPSTQRYIAIISIAVTASYMLTHGFHYKLFLFIGFIISSFVAYNHPLLIIFAHFIFSIIPNMLLSAVEDPYTWRNLTKGIGVHDIVLGSMIVAVFIRICLSTQKERIAKFESARFGFVVGKYVTLFVLWFIFEIVRNIKLYGLSAPGEFRSHYLILALPLYISIFFDTAKKRVSLFKLTIFISCFLPFLLIPVIGDLKGWSIGPESRFFHAFISIGILYGIFASALACKYGLIKIPKMLLWLGSSASALILILDSHRSVWFAAVILFFLTLWFKEVQIRKLQRNFLFYIAAFFCIIFVASNLITSVMDTGLIDFVVERSGDVFKIGETDNTTTSWRVAKWRVQLQRLYNSPFIGLGFGGYWGVSGLEGDVGISPHNLYIQIVVKLGIIGLFLYLMIVANVFRNLKYGFKVLTALKDPETAIIITGIIILLASHAFYMVYSLEDYSLIFIGLSIAVLRSKLVRRRPLVLNGKIKVAELKPILES